MNDNWKQRFETLKQEHIDTINRNEEKQQKIDLAISFIKILQNNLKDYTEYEEYTKIFNEMLKDILQILGDKDV